LNNKVGNGNHITNSMAKITREIYSENDLFLYTFPKTTASFIIIFEM